MSDTDLTESSIDGSIEPAIHIPNSPGDSGFYSPANPSSPQHNQYSFYRTSKPTKMFLNDEDNNNTFEDLKDNKENNETLSVCFRISQFLNEQGYYAAPFIAKDIILNEKSILIDEIEIWAESVFAAIIEMRNSILSNQNAVKDASQSHKKSEVDKDSLYNKIDELQQKIHQYEQKEKNLYSKLKLLESTNEQKKISTNKDDLKKSIKNMENQFKEIERRCRVKDLEIEKLKQKLLFVAEKERDNHTRNKHIINRIKSGDLSFITDIPTATSQDMSHRHKTSTRMDTVNTSFTSNKSNSKSYTTEIKSSRSSSSSTAANSVPFSVVVDALENQRVELFTKNKDLEIQVENLLSSLKSQQNEWDERKSNRIHFFNTSNTSNNTSEYRSKDQDLSDIQLSEEGEDEGLGDANNRSFNPIAKHYTPTARKMYDKIMQQEEDLEYYKRQLDVARALQIEKDEILSSFRKRSEELHEEIENLRLQLDNRPTMKQWTQAQREHEFLEEKLHDLILLRGESAEIAMWRKHLSTQDRIKVDKRNHELGLWLLDSLPKTTMKEVLQSVCRELDITEISEIHPSLVKLKAVVKSIPRMERFISQICSFVFQRHPTLGEIDGMKVCNNENSNVINNIISKTDKDGDNNTLSQQYTMEHILPILRRWWFAAQRCVELDQFHKRVLLELYRRQEILARKESIAIGKNAMDNLNPRFPQHLRTNVEIDCLKHQWETEGKYQWACKDPEKIFEVIRDLVDFQSEVMHHDQSLIYAEDYIREKPEIMVNRIVGHIQYLFEIKSLDGVLPRLNQVYLFMEEVRNFLTSMRKLVYGNINSNNSEVASSNATLFTEIQRRLVSYSGTHLASNVH